MNITANSNNGSGIYLFLSKYTIISNSIASNNRKGIYLQGSSNNTISNNSANSNNNTGIVLGSASNNNTISDNTANSNKIWGIILSGAGYNTIKNNRVSNNDSGIYLFHSKNNRIYHNNFINNGTNAYDDTGNNYWNAIYPAGGNYWSDYNGTDKYSGPNQDQQGGDGIGDAPYTNIGGGAGEQDNYPLMSPWSPSYTTPSKSGASLEFPWLYLILAIIIALAIVAALLAKKRRSGASPEYPEQPEYIQPMEGYVYAEESGANEIAEDEFEEDTDEDWPSF